MSLDQVGFSLLLLGLGLLVGMGVRLLIKPLQKLYIPTSIITGLLLLALGDEVLGPLASSWGWSALEEGLFPEHVLEVWDALPELLISVIFASLFLGKDMPGIRKIWKIAGPQLAFGQTVAWGQYVLGILLAVLVLAPFFDMPYATGALIEISFAGGHGTAAGLSGTFENIEFEEGLDLAMGLATISMLSGILLCIALINWGSRKKQAEHVEEPEERTDDELKGVVDKDDQKPAGRITTRAEAIEPLTLHAGFIAAAILVGYVLLEGLIWLEGVTWGRGSEQAFMEYVPLFVFAMLGSVLIQIGLKFTGHADLINQGLMMRLQGWALDFLIVSALATLGLSVIGEYLVPFLLIAAVGLGWSLFTFLVLASRMMPKHWFERGMSDLGQSLGMTATGLLMLRIVDPDNRTQSVDSFGYKQLLFEPILGGGLFTALSMPIIFELGPYPVLAGTAVLAIGWLLFGLLHFGRRQAEGEG
ncbi:sodium/glutamate symporter [Paenibacillus sp. 1P07SE]|uniref:sodium/glutamate symporter n=1 Tax=Paenibacillus sp. 1P07SE TaxID=3132209 RepID=UPI0039A4C07E